MLNFKYATFEIRDSRFDIRDSTFDIDSATPRAGAHIQGLGFGVDFKVSGFGFGPPQEIQSLTFLENPETIVFQRNTKAQLTKGDPRKSMRSTRGDLKLYFLENPETIVFQRNMRAWLTKGDPRRSRRSTPGHSTFDIDFATPRAGAHIQDLGFGVDFRVSGVGRQNLLNLGFPI